MRQATVSRPPRRPRARHRSALAIGLTAVVAVFAVAGCSSDSGSDSGGASTVSTLPGAAGDPTSVDSAGVDPASSASNAVTPDSGEVTSTTAVATTTTTIPPTTTTIIPLVTEGALVLVANAAGIPGAAGQLTATMQSLGFSMKEPTDAAGYEESLDASKIYFRPEAEAAAASLAAVMQINSLSRMPTPAPIVGAQVGLGDATVLIMLGRDLAGKDVPGFAGR